MLITTEQMPRETLCCLVVACAYGFVPAAVPRAPSALRETNPDFIVSDEMPKRWSKVHDCERPKRWREEYVDDEDCQGYVSGEEFERRAGAKSSPYLETIGTITTLDDFYAAVARSAESDRLFVLKFYSKTCRACLRICASDICGWSAAADGKLAMSSPAIPATPGGLCGIKFQAPHAIDAMVSP